MKKTPDKADTDKENPDRIFLHQEMTLVMVLNRITMDTVEIPVKAMNLGRDKIYNASVSLKADELSSNDTAFLGTIEAGDLSQGSLRIYVKKNRKMCRSINSYV